MKLVCPVCGATASREAWENDAAARQYEGILPMLDPRVLPHVSHYIGLFRKGGRGLAWKRAVKILLEVRELMSSGTIQWDGGEVRPAPPQLWAEAMETMIARGLKELDGHNYLRKIVWEKAKPLAARAEQVREEAARHGMREPERVSEEERTSVKKLFESFKKDPRGFVKKHGSGS